MSKRYFWLKLNENFFEREEIRVIENMANGKDYIIFYMKLLLKSIGTEGKLKFRDVIPYTPDMLAAITGTSVDTVKVAIDLFTKLDLMELWDDGTLFMVETQNMIGSETEWAKKKREYRERKEALPKVKEDTPRTMSTPKEDNVQEKEDNVWTMSGQNEDEKGKSPTDIELDIELDKDIDIELSLQQSCKDDETFKYEEGSIEIQLARLMIDTLLETKPDSKVPNRDVKSLQNWAQHIDYMIRLDKREPKAISNLFRWAQRDNFWMSNIRSPRKLREKWDTLELQKIRESPKNDNLSRIEEMYRKAKAEEGEAI